MYDKAAEDRSSRERINRLFKSLSKSTRQLGILNKKEWLELIPGSAQNGSAWGVILMEDGHPNRTFLHLGMTRREAVVGLENALSAIAFTTQAMIGQLSNLQTLITMANQLSMGIDLSGEDDDFS